MQKAAGRRGCVCSCGLAEHTKHRRKGSCCNDGVDFSQRRSRVVSKFEPLFVDFATYWRLQSPCRDMSLHGDCFSKMQCNGHGLLQNGWHTINKGLWCSPRLSRGVGTKGK